MDRREFLETSAVLAGGALASRVPEGSPRAEPPMIGIQVGAVSFVDEGTERVLDNLHELAAVNTMFVATFTYGRGIAGRQLPGSRCRTTASRSTTLDKFHGGNFATPHPQYYRNTAIAPRSAGPRRIRRAGRRAARALTSAA